MAECPFCKATIDDELARFGGHCSKCFIEIPGEDTPTDPGVAKRIEQQLEQERQRPWARIAGFAALAAVVLLAAGAVVAWRVVHERGATAQAAEGDQGSDDNETFYIAPASEHALPRLGAARSAGGEPARARSGGHRHGSAEVTEVGSDDAGGQNRFDFIGTSDEGMPELAEVAKRTVEVVPGAVEQSTPSLSSVTPPRVEITRGSASSMALRDADEIYQAVGQALKSYAGQMTSCYERRLKAVPSLRGTWATSFTITESGSTSGIQVQGQAQQDSELERCLTETMARWTFQPMVQEQEIQKNYTFGPAE